MSVIRLASHRIELSNLDKELFPQDGISKGEVIDYYRHLAGTMLKHARGRLLTMKRFPDGIGRKGFIQQSRSRHFPAWIEGVNVKRMSGKGGRIEHVAGDSTATLVYLANQAVLEFHGWLSRRPRLAHPDRLIFDLDPPGEDFGAVIRGARRVRDLMEELGLCPHVMTTGSRGLHVVAPLDGKTGFDEARAAARAMARHLARQHPKELTVEQRKNKRRGRLYLDVMRNARGQTAVLPYSLRAKRGAPVATPLGWNELGRKGLDARTYRLGNLRRRLQEKGDPWASIERNRRSISTAMNKLEKLDD